jgi:hypothetical protein
MLLSKAAAWPLVLAQRQINSCGVAQELERSLCGVHTTWLLKARYGKEAVSR